MNTPGGTVAGWWDYSDKALIPAPRDRDEELVPATGAVKRYRLVRVGRQRSKERPAA